VGKILRVDLSERAVADEGLDEAVLRDFVGEVGVAANILYNETPRGVDSCRPLNPLIFATGPLTGECDH